jgi:hypothetical protein
LSLRPIGTGLENGGEDTVFRINVTEKVSGVKLHVLGGPFINNASANNKPDFVGFRSIGFYYKT